MNTPNPHKHERMESLIKELSAKFIQQESNGQSLITITHVDLAPNNKRATIFISVLPENKENAALDFITRQLGDLRKFISDNGKIGILPFLDVKIDFGEKNRQNLDRISATIAKEV